MTSAKRELIDSAVFFDFLVAAGAIVALPRLCYEDVFECAPVLELSKSWNLAAAKLFVWDGLACQECQEKADPLSGLQYLMTERSSILLLRQKVQHQQNTSVKGIASVSVRLPQSPSPSRLLPTTINTGSGPKGQICCQT